MGNIPLSPILMMMHQNNTVNTSLEGYVSASDLSRFTNIPYEKGKKIYNLSPGMYRTTINGTQYCIILHDVLNGLDYLQINDVQDSFIHDNNKDRSIRLYKINQVNKYKELEDEYYELPSSINDKLDVLIVDGSSSYPESNNWGKSLDHPYELYAPSTIEVDTFSEDDSETNEAIIYMKNYLKSVGDEYDTMLMEPGINRASFIFKTARQSFSGFEYSWEKIEEYSNDNVSVYWFPSTLVKINTTGNINCTHLNSIPWSSITNTNLIIQGISPGGIAEYQGICVKLLTSEYPDVDSFMDKLNYWYRASEEEIQEKLDAEREAQTSGNTVDESTVPIVKAIMGPFTVEYVRSKTGYSSINMDRSDIKTYFNSTKLRVNNYILEDLDTVESIDFHIMYFYKHFYLE